MLDNINSEYFSTTNSDNGKMEVGLNRKMEVELNRISKVVKFPTVFRVDFRADFAPNFPAAAPPLSVRFRGLQIAKIH